MRSWRWKKALNEKFASGGEEREEVNDSTKMFH
jgi:hypothetical protein